MELCQSQPYSHWYVHNIYLNLLLQNHSHPFVYVLVGMIRRKKAITTHKGNGKYLS